jgi:LuxR family maltose regulon positive regulatory protein
MDKAAFLSEKFIPATLPQVVAPRHELLLSFHRAAENRFVYVGAPAGSGKTVSALLWLKNVNRKSVWIGLDTYDSTPSVFFMQLSPGLLSTQPNNAGMLRVLSDPAFSASPVEHTVELISEMHPEETPHALVLDDLHLISNIEIFKAVPLIMRRLPRNFVVVVLSRFAPPDEFEPLIKEDTIIGPEQLRFSEEEISSYFDSLGQFLTPEESHRAYRATEGWAMGVNAIAQSGGAQTPGGFDFFGYFESQIWDKWRPELQKFCLDTAVVNEFGVELAGILTERDDAEDVLSELSRTNAFLSRLRDDTYRYHHLFQDFLRAKLRTMDEKRASLLCKKAAEYYKDNKDYSRALSFWMDSGDWKGIDSYLLLFLFRNNRGGVADYADYLRGFFDNGFPKEAYKQMPALHVLAAWYYYITSRAVEYAEHMDAIMKSLPAIAKAGNEFVEFSILAFSVDHRRSMAQKEKLYGLFSRFLQKYTPDGLATNIASYTHGLPYMNRCNVDYDEFALDPNWINGIDRTFAPLLGEEWSYIKPNMNATFAYERNELEEALGLNEEAAEIITPAHKIEGRVCVALLRHSILWQMGLEDEAAKAKDMLVTLVQEHAQDFIPNLRAYGTKLRLYMGNLNAARVWLDEYFVFHVERIELFRVFQHFTTVRAYMAVGEFEEARRLLDLLLAYGRSLNRPMDECEALILLAALDWAQGSRKEAEGELEAALVIAQPYGYIRMFADEGGAILPILKRILTKCSRDDYQGGLQRPYLNEVMLLTHAFAKTHPGYITGSEQDVTKPIKLSRQQKCVITLLSQGLRNAEICERTGLKLPTIKTHTAIAYQKLGVTNAMDAVLRARELGLIE